LLLACSVYQEARIALLNCFWVFLLTLCHLESRTELVSRSVLLWIV
jgi:hypothetical protein